jgi:hypothetical protein
MTVMVYGYTGLLIASPTIPEMTKPVETLEDVVASNDQVVLYINPDGLAGFGKAVMASLIVFLYITDYFYCFRLSNLSFTMI